MSGRHLPRRSAPILLAVVLAAALAGCSGTDEPPPEAAPAEAATGREAAAAVPGIPVPDSDDPVPIAGGEVHHRDFALTAGDFLQLVVEQQGIDLAVRFLDPEGRLLIRVDSPNGADGPEELVAVAAASGPHRFEVVAPDDEDEAGHYALRVAARRPATEEDRDLVAADRAYHRGRRLLKAHRAGEALAPLRQALATWSRLGSTAREGFTLDALHRAYRVLKKPEVAVVLCDRAAERFRQSGDPLQTAVALQNGGWLRLRLGQPERAIELLEEAVPLFEQVDYGWAVARTLGYLGAAYRDLGRLQHGLRSFDRALERARSLGDRRAEAVLLSDRGAVLMDLNRPREALDGYARAAEIARSGDELRSTLVLALTGIARAALRSGDFERAAAALAEAKPLVGRPDTARERVWVESALGELRRRRGELSGAREAFSRSLAAAREVKDRRAEAYRLLELGHLEVLGGDPGRGLELHDQALAIFTEMGDPLGQASARVRGAQALASLGRLAEARERIGPALADVEALRAGTDRPDYRSSYFAHRQEYFEIAIEVLVELHDRDPAAGYHLAALELNERRLARELVEGLEGDGSPGRDEIAPELTARERVLEARLAAAAGRELAPGPEAADEEEIDRLLGELYRLRAAIDGAVAAGAPAALETATVAEIREGLLDPDSLLLVYALGERRSLLWGVSRDAVTVHSLPPRREIEGLARAFSERVVARRRREREAARRLGSRLSRVLLRPVASRLGARRLVLVTEGALQAVPFAALPEPGDGEDYLLWRHVIVTLPSATSLATLRRAEAGRPAGPRPIAAFADPVFARDDPRVAGRGAGREAGGIASAVMASAAPARSAAEDPDGERLRAEITRSAGGLGLDPFARLPGSRGEVEGIVTLAPPGRHLVATGFEASREALTGGDLAGYGILHFATHALAHPEHPELSGLVLSMVDREGRPRNGFLRAYEISRLDLPADLVVLSACETGLGKDLRGEGMLSLTRSFLSAGATRVIATLWQVSDRSSAALMQRFYRGYLRTGLAPPAALREAQLALLDDPSTAAPYYWAGFLYHGEWRRPR